MLWPPPLRLLNVSTVELVLDHLSIDGLFCVVPPLLADLNFPENFNGPFVEVRWPASLRRLTLDNLFDKAMDRASWPASLEGLDVTSTTRYVGCRGRKLSTLMNLFDEPIDRVSWPLSLEKLRFGNIFNQPIGGVSSPLSLKNIIFGPSFDKPIDRVS